MAHKPNFTAQLTNKEAVRQVAASIGCIHTRGSEKGKGSIREMLEEIGGGNILVMFHQYDDAEEMQVDAIRLRKFSEQFPYHEKIVQILNALASSLEKMAETHD